MTLADDDTNSILADDANTMPTRLGDHQGVGKVVHELYGVLPVLGLWIGDGFIEMVVDE